MYVQRAGAHQLDSRCCPLPAAVLDDAEESANGFHLPLNRFPRWLWVILLLEQSRNLHKVHSNA
jgi:hypothetical protein